MSRTWLPRPRITLGRLMAVIAGLAAVFAVMRLPFGLPVVWVGSMTTGAAIAYRRGRSGFLGGIAVGAAGTLGLGIYQRVTHQYVFDSSTGSGPMVTAIILAVYVGAGIVQGTLASIPVWLIASVHRAERERQEAREAMAVQGDREGDHPS
ncbi:MAG: hypothetical protein ACYC61_25815 [Isosphaeraceae bacterium]